MSNDPRRVIIGTFFKTEQLALKEIERREKIHKAQFVLIEFETGFLVVAAHQVEVFL